MGGEIEKRGTVDIKRLVEKARSDVALANPVGFLIRLMSGEEINGEHLSLRDRMDVAKFLTGRLVPQVDMADLEGGANTRTPPPLVISLNVSPQESLKVVEEQAERDKNTIDVIANAVGLTK